MIVADTHVHVYAGYDLARLLSSACEALSRAGGEGDSRAPQRMLFLTESNRHRVWSEWMAAEEVLPGTDWSFHPSPEEGAGWFSHPAHGVVWVFAGRQVITAERLEVLVLTSDRILEDGQPAREVVDAALQSAAIPVLSWSPGKWWGRRGRCVSELLQRYSPRELWIGDILLRPRKGWSPLLLHRARRRGFIMLAGTDPLPVSGEERLVGRYASLMDMDFDPERPVTSVREGLRSPGLRVERVGRRNTAVEMVGRMLEARRARKNRPLRE